MLGTRADAWLAAAVAAVALGAEPDARLFLARAAERAGGAWPSPHAAESFRALAAALGAGGTP
jgi:hypothetical protein